MTAIALAGIGAAQATPGVSRGPGRGWHTPPSIPKVTPRFGDVVTPSSAPGKFVDVGGTMSFTADDGVHGRELWKSDGTRSGTVLVKDINPGARDACTAKGHPWSPP